MKKAISLLLCLMLLLALTACGTTTPDPTEVSTEDTQATSALAESEVTGVSFTVVVTDTDGSEQTFDLTSSANTLGEALLQEGIIDGDDTEYGLYVTTVNGVVADWTTENAYWALYIDGEYAQTGVDSTELTEGTTYSFVKTVSYTTLGEGETMFYLTVKDTDGSVTRFQIYTDATTVGEALVALELISGDEGDYGLYVTTVNGITADWETENAYWAFSIDGEYAQTGVDSTEIVAGSTYELAKTITEA